MASSPYRFTLQTDRAEDGTPRSRVGLSSITTGGGGSAGGEGYRASALRPGSSGFMAATFGGEPRTDYVKPTTTATVTAPNPTPEAPAAALAPEYLGDSGMGGEGGGAGSGQTGGPTGFDNGGQPGDLSNVVGDIGLDGKTIGGLLGGVAGGFALGPLGALGGALAGRAIGSQFGTPANGDYGLEPGMFSGNEQMGQNMNSDANNENASAGPSVEVADAVNAGYAAGGRVDPRNLLGSIPMDNKPKGLAQVQNFGGYAEGGPVMSNNDVNAALWRRAQAQTAPTPEMVQAARVANAPTEMRRGGMRFAENNAQTDAYMNARFGSDPQFRPEARYLGDPAYLTGEGQGMDDPLLWYLMQQRQRDAVNQNTQMIEGAPIGPDHPMFTQRAMRQPQFRGAYAMGGHVPNYAGGGPVDGAALAGPNPPGPDDGFAALDGGEFVVRQSQAQRPDYASVLEQINQGTYEPAEGEAGAMGGSTTEGIMPAEGGGNGADPASLPPMMQQALGQAVAADPMLAQALTSLLGPEAVHELMECCGGGGMGMGEDMAKGGHETPFGRPPLAGPKPPPGINAPPGVRPPPAANPTMQMPPPMMGGLRGVMA